MKEFVEYIAKQLVDNPEAVQVTQIDSEKTTIYELSVGDGDLGKIIGKKGRTAQSIRTLLTAASAKLGGKRALLEIVE
ncbi:MAG: KH domain-containing protein [Candidatus Marinimicrobia bacterium]|nr:KH domain-containing protein [Candidatus Neomarinimicrobiota bacterium]MCF7829610.1 KH domain-containing protein [Candidatus Neomarinimicrobiota bacterium]MCF7879770.1 KH domain-containing protein [Candidatus Neomarinimicrobiota bacterium]